jgi:hypothetical protein
VVALSPKFIVSSQPSTDAPRLCVNIDTEETFDWTAPFCRGNTSADALTHLHRGHELFRKYGLKPAYLVDYPIVCRDDVYDILGKWAKDDECVIGAHLHPWVNPPHVEVVCPLNSFPCNLPPEVERAKLERLTEKIREALGCAPRVYRAGRYGIDVSREKTLSDLGYLVDTSVMPFRSYAGSGGGPDFFGFPDEPFWTRERGEVLFLPVTQTLVGPLRFVSKIGGDRLLFGQYGSKLRVPGVLARLKLLERITLTPEGVMLSEVLRLLDDAYSWGRRVFCLTLHSPSFMPGGTPYTRTDRDLEDFLYRIDAILDYFFTKLGGVATTALELYELLRGRDAHGQTLEASNDSRRDSPTRKVA